MSHARDFFTEEDLTRIRKAIKDAELKTSGEIRVHIESELDDASSALDRASELFADLNMHLTDSRNGVLFYLAIDSHKFAILGDLGINQKTGKNFWKDIKNEMQANFKKGEFTEGLVLGINEAGKKLQEFFPYQRDDVNELPDEITFE